MLGTALAPEPEKRYPDAGAFLTALQSAAEERFGAGWIARAGLAALGGAAGAAGAAPLLAAGPSAPPAAGDAVPAAARRVLRGRWAKVAAGGAVAVSGAAAIVLITGGSAKADPGKAFTGTYRLDFVVTSADSENALHPTKVGTTDRSYMRVRAACDGDQCSATGTGDSGRVISFTYAGGTWTSVAEYMDVRCLDTATGNELPGTVERSVYRLMLSAAGTGAAPEAYTGSLDGKTTAVSGCTGGEHLVETVTATRLGTDEAATSFPADPADQARAFTGTYKVAKVVTVSEQENVLGAQDPVGTKTTEYWKVAADCPAGGCHALLTYGDGSTGGLDLHGGAWSARSEQSVRCLDAAGKEIAGSSGRKEVAYSLRPAGTDGFAGTFEFATQGGSCAGKGRVVQKVTLDRVAAAEVPATAFTAASPS